MIKLETGELVEFDSCKPAFWHTSSHILAQAVKRLYPTATLAIGPSIDSGFYYDIDNEETFSEEKLLEIEKEMQKIIKENHKIERFILSREQALEQMKNEPYKTALINDLPKDAELSFYKQGEFVDLCAGPHLSSTGQVVAVKLTSCTGAYWRGDSENKMLKRIYGISFGSKNELKEHLEMLQEAKKRDHRKLGKELDLFDIYDEGPGFPFFMPNGMILRNELEQYWRDMHKKAGYQEIKTPIILSRKLWEQSGHWGHYQKNMYTTVIDEQDYAIKPMNCPGGILVYKRKITSYKELPIRTAEMGLVHRHELSGALHGLMRVRNFTQDDAHIFMMPQQIKDEIFGVIKLSSEIYKQFGFEYKVELSTRPENSMGTNEQWEVATESLREALVEYGMPFTVNEGDGAFYGPKIDFHLKDSLGRTWQCGTIQLDMNLPERFELAYIGADGEKHRPVMIHRTIFGSMERFIGILIEHFAGAFPVWLSPVQVMIVPISEAHHGYAKEILEQLEQQGIRAEADYRAEKMNYKIREAQLRKIPYMLVVGDKELENKSVAVRARKEENGGVKSLVEFIAATKKEIDLKEQ